MPDWRGPVESKLADDLHEIHHHDALGPLEHDGDRTGGFRFVVVLGDFGEDPEDVVAVADFSQTLGGLPTGGRALANFATHIVPPRNHLAHHTLDFLQTPLNRREAEAGLETETLSVAGRVRRVEKERDQSVADARKDSAAKVRAADSALAKAETARATAEAARAKAVAGAVSLRREIATGRADLERMEARAERAELAARSPAPVTAPSPVSPPSVRPPVSPAAPREYQVKKGDSLTKIAQLMYADATRWKEIYTANSDKMGTSGRLRVGQVLVIPEGR